MAPIFSKPLRALPFSMQIGNIDAVTFCLSMDTGLIEFNDELVRLIQESIALADADDAALSSKSSHPKSIETLNNLRIVCVRLLSVAMSMQEFSVSESLNPTRFRIV